MKFSNAAYRIGTALALAVAVIASPARATVLLGSDYFETTQPTFFVVPSGYPNAGTIIPVKGLPIGPGTTDTIVQRQGNCVLLPSSSCTIPIEMVKLSLIGANDPTLRFRESPTRQSTGMMTIFSNGSLTGGTFNSFFDIFIELSTDSGLTFSPFDLNPITTIIDPLHLVSTGTNWTTIQQGLLVDGLIGDQNANRHTDKQDIGGGLFACPSPISNIGEICSDFYLLGGGVVTETDVVATHTARGAVVPEPGSLALVSLALATMIGLKRNGATIDV